jgi:hypothetical protein
MFKYMMNVVMFSVGLMLISTNGLASSENKMALGFESSHDFKTVGLGYKLFDSSESESTFSLKIEEYVPFNPDLLDLDQEKNLRIGAGLKSSVVKSIVNEKDIKLKLPVEIEFYGGDQEEIRTKFGGSVGIKINNMDAEFGNSLYVSYRLGLSDENLDQYSYGVLSSVILSL